MAIDMNQSTSESTPVQDIEPKRKRVWWIVGVAVVVTAAATFALVSASGSNDDAADGTTAALNTAQVVRIDLADETTSRRLSVVRRPSN